MGTQVLNDETKGRILGDEAQELVARAFRLDRHRRGQNRHQSADDPSASLLQPAPGDHFSGPPSIFRSSPRKNCTASLAEASTGLRLSPTRAPVTRSVRTRGSSERANRVGVSKDVGTGNKLRPSSMAVPAVRLTMEVSATCAF